MNFEIRIRVTVIIVLLNIQMQTASSLTYKSTLKNYIRLKAISIKTS